MTKTDDRLREILNKLVIGHYAINHEIYEEEDTKVVNKAITAIKEIMVEKDMVEVHEYWTKKKPSVEEMEKWIVKFIAGDNCSMRDFKSRIVGKDELQDLAEFLCNKMEKMK